MGRLGRYAAVISCLVLGLAACKGAEERASSPSPTQASTPVQVVSSGSLAAGQPIAPPSGAVVLTMSGAIRARNQGKNLALDLASLERMRTSRLVTDEPFLKRRATFEGVLLADLLAVAEVAPTASKLHLTALDDYTVDFSLADVRSSQMLLATKHDGKHMAIDRAGPIRIVFPEGSKVGRNPDLWIWSVSTMQVR